jgi:NDP-sugar pyrophosphorylase family protein
MIALILCGGLGERLRPHTEKVPKVMLEVNGRPILEQIIGRLKESGITEIVLLCGYLYEKIALHFGDGKKFGVNIQYSVEKEKLGTGGAVKNAKKFVDEDFILINGDVVTDFPLKDLIDAFGKTGKNVLCIVRPFNPFGVAKISHVDGSVCRIDSFEEKPKMNDWINAGYTVMKRSVIDDFPDKGDVETQVYPKLQADGEILGFMIEDKYFWKSIDTSKDLREMNREKK